MHKTGSEVVIIGLLTFDMFRSYHGKIGIDVCSDIVTELEMSYLMLRTVHGGVDGGLLTSGYLELVIKKIIYSMFKIDLGVIGGGLSLTIIFSKLIECKAHTLGVSEKLMEELGLGLSLTCLELIKRSGLLTLVYSELVTELFVMAYHYYYHC